MYRACMYEITAAGSGGGGGGSSSSSKNDKAASELKSSEVTDHNASMETALRLWVHLQVTCDV
jgi:hypothetical protein